jgi:hypothetical protein
VGDQHRRDVGSEKNDEAGCEAMQLPLRPSLQRGVGAHLRIFKKDGVAAEFAEIIKTFLKKRSGALNRDRRLSKIWIGVSRPDALVCGKLGVFG